MMNRISPRDIPPSKAKKAVKQLLNPIGRPFKSGHCCALGSYFKSIF